MDKVQEHIEVLRTHFKTGVPVNSIGIQQSLDIIEQQQRENKELSARVTILSDQDRWYKAYGIIYTEREIEIGRHAGTKLELEEAKREIERLSSRVESLEKGWNFNG